MSEPILVSVVVPISSPEAHPKFVVESMAAALQRSGYDCEFVLVLDGAAPAAPPSDDEIIAALRAEIAAGVSRKDAASRVSARLGVAKRHVYELTLSLG